MVNEQIVDSEIEENADKEEEVEEEGEESYTYPDLKTRFSLIKQAIDISLSVEFGESFKQARNKETEIDESLKYFKFEASKKDSLSILNSLETIGTHIFEFKRNIEDIERELDLITHGWRFNVAYLCAIAWPLLSKDKLIECRKKLSEEHFEWVQFTLGEIENYSNSVLNEIRDLLVERLQQFSSPVNIDETLDHYCRLMDEIIKNEDGKISKGTPEKTPPTEVLPIEERVLVEKNAIKISELIVKRYQLNSDMIRQIHAFLLEYQFIVGPVDEE